MTEAPTPLHRIDVHHHIVPPRYLREARDAVVAQGGGDPAVLNDILGWTPQKSIETMDRKAASVLPVACQPWAHATHPTARPSK